MDDADADGSYEGEFGMMERSWGKMPYPKFLETEPAVIADGDAVLWVGMCYFVYRGRAVVARDGAHEEVNARMTTDADLTGLMRRFDGNSFGLDFKIRGRCFAMVSATPSYNPDGSFHHITFGLLERAEADAVC